MNLGRDSQIREPQYITQGEVQNLVSRLYKYEQDRLHKLSEAKLK